jgi:hypothetical protein
MEAQNSKNKLLLFGFLAAVIASMTFIAGSGGIKAAIAQGTNETSSPSGMNMTGTQGGGGGGATNQTTTTITRDTVTILLEGKSIPGMGFLHLYDSTPYKIGNGHIALHVPCDTSSKPIVNVLVGQAPNVKPVEPELVKELSTPGTMCIFHVDIGSDTAQNVTQTDIAIQNPSNQTITFPAGSGITIGVNEIKLIGEEHTHGE